MVDETVKKNHVAFLVEIEVQVLKKSCGVCNHQLWKIIKHKSSQNYQNKIQNLRQETLIKLRNYIVPSLAWENGANMKIGRIVKIQLFKDCILNG